ncbi:MAG: hypothetical protein ABI605_21940 [Rhizobacter sp.]
MQHTRRTWAWAGVLSCLAMLAGCGAIQHVPVNDDNSASVAVRASFHRRSAETNERYGSGIEVGYESYRARDTQTLAAGESISLDGGTVFGPSTLQHEARLRQGYVTYNHLLRFGPHFQLEPFVGLTRVNLRIRSDPGSGSTLLLLDEWRSGVLGGVTPRWCFNDWVAIEARLSYFDTGDWVHGKSYEAALVLSPVPNVSVRLGYSERYHDVETLGSGWSSEVNIRARGPLATLQLNF